jgi:hypothetical protein
MAAAVATHGLASRVPTADPDGASPHSAVVGPRALPHSPDSRIRVDLAIETDDDVLMLALAYASRAATTLNTPPVTEESYGRARWSARDLATILFLQPGNAPATSGVSISAGILAAAYATRLDAQLGRIVAERADCDVAEIVADVYHLCRHLGVRLEGGNAAHARGDGRTMREHLREQIATLRPAP